MQERTYRSFLVRLWREPAAADGAWNGEIEHVQSGRIVAAESLDALLAVLRWAAIEPRPPAVAGAVPAPAGAIAAEQRERQTTMILVRTVFQAQWGKGGELARFFTEAGDRMPASMRLPTRVLTDLTGPFDTVVVEAIVESVDDYQRRLRAMYADQDAQQQSAVLRELIAEGHREYYTIEGEF